MHSGVLQSWHQFARGMEQLLNGVHVGLLVVSGVFECRADNDASVAARHQIDFVGANYMLQLRAANDSYHLPFNWAYRKLLRSNAACPGPSAVHYDSARVN